MRRDYSAGDTIGDMVAVALYVYMKKDGQIEVWMDGWVGLGWLVEKKKKGCMFDVAFINTPVGWLSAMNEQCLKAMIM